MKKKLIPMICIALACVFFLVSQARAEYQPAMKQALEFLKLAKIEKVGDGKIKHLNAANAELDKADHDKGGFRVKAKESIQKALEAIEANNMRMANKFIQEAIVQVKKGIAYDNRHKGK
jgi:hypothetical protein